MRRLRTLAGSTLAWLAVLAIAGAAIAGAVASSAPDPADQAIANRSDRAAERAGGAGAGEPAVEQPGAQGEEVAAEGAGKPNHGECVSATAHAAQDEGLEGSARGERVSAAAQSDGVGPDCVAPQVTTQGETAEGSEGHATGQDRAAEARHHGEGAGHDDAPGQGHDRHHGGGGS